MQVMPLDILIAHKAINLSTALSNSDKRVAGALLDHFNRKTGQCDPGQKTVAELIGMSRRTVIRSVERLVRLGLFRKIRHGGKYHRNKYEPMWSAFRKLDALWVARRKVRQQTRAGPNLSRCEGHASHRAGDADVHQTCIKNQSKETSTVDDIGQSSRPPIIQARQKGPAEEVRCRIPASLPQSLGAPCRIAARDSAERRWNGDLLNRYAGQPALLGHIVDSIDSDLMSSTTDIELRQRGSGLAYLVGELEARERAFRSKGADSTGENARGGKDDV